MPHLQNLPFTLHRFIAEETSSASTEENVLTDTPTWIIDPIDGTFNFIHKVPLIAIGIALVYKKQVVMAVTFNPIINEMFTATLGGGAFLDDEPIRVSQVKELKYALVADEISLAHLMKHRDRLMSRTVNTVTQAPGMRALGTGVLTLAYVAAGRIDAYQLELLKPWDVAGGTLLITEAGGVVRDSYTGGDFNIMKPNVLVASTQELYEAMWRISQECTGKKIIFE